MSHGAAQCDATITHLLAHGYMTLGITDDYDFWDSKNEADNAGKLCLIERATAESDISRHVMFFDDNIELTHSHIVDARDHITGAAIPFEETKDVYLHRVRPIEVILDKHYFIAEIAKMEAKLVEYELHGVPTKLKKRH
jgi:hypothetical protein